jgi:hypothetical protein
MCKVFQGKTVPDYANRNEFATNLSIYQRLPQAALLSPNAHETLNFARFMQKEFGSLCSPRRR